MTDGKRHGHSRFEVCRLLPSKLEQKRKVRLEKWHSGPPSAGPCGRRLLSVLGRLLAERGGAPVYLLARGASLAAAAVALRPRSTVSSSCARVKERLPLLSGVVPRLLLFLPVRSRSREGARASSFRGAVPRLLHVSRCVQRGRDTPAPANAYAAGNGERRCLDVVAYRSFSHRVACTP
ncbi:hypothetical protein NDU88_004717 [Pleurodeles waltl]|uniref:Uncharacterized protein n=1 Tax=Pleurodeles waltl TaxID=8319 RepID=A0AAV7UK17_PLEWA|nr:hypothetical protein NDU88_004717 [Pleurodeles waltl]